MPDRLLLTSLDIADVEPGSLRVLSYAADEHLSEWMTLVVDFESTLPLGPADLLGHVAALRVLGAEAGDRAFHGFIAALQVTAQTQGTVAYHATITSRVARLSRGRHQRIFQHVSVKTVMETLFRENGLAVDDYQWWVKHEPHERAYIVQNGESDFAFLARLLADEGIGFAVWNDLERDTVVFFDDSTRLEPIVGLSTLLLRDQTVTSNETVWALAEQAGAAHDAVELRDNDYHRAQTLRAADDIKHLGARWELDALELPPPVGRESYLHRGGFSEEGAGKRRAARIMEALRCGARVISGTSDCFRLEPGRWFSVGMAPRSTLPEGILVISLRHTGNFQAGADSGTLGYQSEFVAIPLAVPFRPARADAAARPAGVQVGFITTPGGEDIHTDEFGRVKLRFPWDRAGIADDHSSTWARVGQPILGGGMVLPREGFEVIVDFEEGDVDRPFVAGHLYNDSKPPPYQLPDHKTMTSIQSATTQGGPGSNELRYEDAKGQEEIFLNASKDLKVDVTNDESAKVAVDEHRAIGGDHRLNVGANWRAQVGKNRQVEIHGSQSQQVDTRTETIGADETITIGIKREGSVTGDLKEEVVLGLSRHVGAAQAVVGVAGYERTVDGDSLVAIGAAMVQTVGTASSTDVGKAYLEGIGGLKKIKAKSASFKVGQALGVIVAKADTARVAGSRSDSGDKVALKADKGYAVKAENITFEAESSLSLTVGKISITLKSDGKVEISGPNVDLTGVEALQGATHTSN